MGERLEILMRIPVAIVSGIIMCVWNVFVRLLVLIQIILVLVTGKRNEAVAELCQYWNSYLYRFARYMTFASNQRPFPFTPFRGLVEPVDMRTCPDKKKS
jgi:hypothetical protein